MIQLQIAVDAVIIGAQAQNIAAANVNNVLGMAHHILHPALAVGIQEIAAEVQAHHAALVR